MTPTNLIFEGWTWNPGVILGIAAAALAWWRRFGARARRLPLFAAVAVVALALMSPLQAIADGVLFSAHMIQHILLLLIAPALVLLSLPADFAPRFSPRVRACLPALGWGAGVGSMWFWHVPALCNAAVLNPAAGALQTVSLLALGTLFWWPILAPREANRLLPGWGVAYLFTACLACTALGILLTLTPIDVCPAFSAPLATGNAWAGLRDQIGLQRDREIGGLLMWVPMCLIYVSAIMLELGRWLGASQPAREERP